MRPKIYLFGDSITEASFADGGWGASLAHHFSRRVDFLVRGYSGYNTRWALKVLDKVFPPEKEVTDGSPVAVTVFSAQMMLVFLIDLVPSNTSPLMSIRITSPPLYPPSRSGGLELISS